MSILLTPLPLTSPFDSKVPQFLANPYVRTPRNARTDSDVH